MKITQHTQRQLLRVSIMGCVFALVGCGNSEPSEAEMFSALKGSGLGLVTESDRADFKKAGCEKAGEKTYKCGVASKEGKGIVLHFGFTKVDGSWHFSQI